MNIASRDPVARDQDAEKTPRNPFPGPVPLTDEQPVFGRDREIGELRGLLLAERIVVLHGVSGAGKSSILRGGGGICTVFDAERNFEVLGPVDFRLSDSNALGENGYEALLLEQLNRRLPRGQREANQALWDSIDLEIFLLRHADQHAGARQLLILDQFEDIFTQHTEDLAGKEAFFRKLGELLEANPDLYLLLSMRDEYLGELDHYRRFVPGRFRATQRLELLHRDRAAEAIIKTAAAAPFERSLCRDDVDNLVVRLSRVSSPQGGTDDATPGYVVEPLFLQLVCNEAWTRLQSENAAGPDGCTAFAKDLTRSDLDEVLAAFYARSIEAVCSAGRCSEHKVRCLVHDGLISSKGLRGLLNEEEATRHWGVGGQQLRALVDEHLIRLQRRNQMVYFELAHDRLVEPIRTSNRVWLSKQPVWRRAARRHNMGNEGDKRLDWINLFRAIGVQRRTPEELAPYEAQYIASQRRRMYVTVALAGGYLGTVALVGIAVAWFSAAQIRGLIAEKEREIVHLQESAKSDKREARRARQQASELLTANQQTTAALDKTKEEVRQREQALREAEEVAAALAESNRTTKAELDRSADRARARGAIAAYVEEKWIARNDQDAVRKVLDAFQLTRRLFGDSPEFDQFENQLVTAFSNALSVTRGAYGFSHTLSNHGDSHLQQAFFAGASPKVAYLDDGCVTVASMRGGGAPRCLYRPDDAAATGAFRFSPDGRLLALGHGDETLLLDAASGELLHQVPGYPDALQFAPGGNTLAVAHAETVRVICSVDVAWHECHRGPTGASAEDPVTRLDLAVAGTSPGVLAIGTQNGAVALYRLTEDASRLQPIDSFDVPGRIYGRPLVDNREVMGLHLLSVNPLRLVVVHADTQLFTVFAAPDGTLRKLPIEADIGSQMYGARNEQDNDHFTSVAFSPDHMLYVTLEDAVDTWDLRRLSFERADAGLIRLPMLHHPTGGRDLSNLTVGSHYLIARGFFHTWLWERHVEGASKLWRTRVPTEDMAFLEDLIYYPQAVATVDGQDIVAGTTLHGLHRWQRDAEGGWQVTELGPCTVNNRPRRHSVRALALSRQKRLVAAASSRRQLMLASLDNPEQPMCNRTEHTDGLWSVAFDRASDWLASGDWQGNLVLWQVGEAGAIRRRDRVELESATRQMNGSDAVMALAFHPQDDLLAAGLRGGEVYLYALDSAQGRLRLLDRLSFPSDANIGSVLELDFSPDGQQLAAAGGKGPVQVWKRVADRFVPDWTLVGHAGGTRSVAFSPDSDQLMSGGADGVLRIWDSDNLARSPAMLTSLDADLLSVAWSPDGDTLVTSYKELPQLPEAGLAPTELSHGSIVTWNWNLDAFATTACEVVWRWPGEPNSACEPNVPPALGATR